jgi:hypothetical protein
MTKIRENLNATQDRQNSYADKNIVFRDFKVGKHVFLKAKEKISLLRLGCCPKLAARHCGPFGILEKTGPVAYMLALSESMRVHNLFHVSLLKKYVSDPNQIIDWVVIQVEHEGDFQVEPMRTLDRKLKVLRKKTIILVKVQ